MSTLDKGLKKAPDAQIMFLQEEIKDLELRATDYKNVDKGNWCCCCCFEDNIDPVFCFQNKDNCCDIFCVEVCMCAWIIDFFIMCIYCRKNTAKEEIYTKGCLGKDPCVGGGIWNKVSIFLGKAISNVVCGPCYYTEKICICMRKTTCYCVEDRTYCCISATEYLEKGALERKKEQLKILKESSEEGVPSAN